MRAFEGAPKPSDEMTQSPLATDTAWSVFKHIRGLSEHNVPFYLSEILCDVCQSPNREKINELIEFLDFNLSATISDGEHREIWGEQSLDVYKQSTQRAREENSRLCSLFSKEQKNAILSWLRWAKESQEVQWWRNEQLEYAADISGSTTMTVPIILLNLFLTTTVPLDWPEVNWTFSDTPQLLAFAVSQSGNIYGISGDGIVLCIKENGELKWKKNLGVRLISSGDFYSNGSNCSVQTLANGNIAFLAFGSNGEERIFLCNNSGDLLQSYGSKVSDFKVQGDCIAYIDGTDVVFVDSKGALQWRHKTPLSCQGLCFQGDAIILNSWPLGILALNKNSGDVLWQDELKLDTGPACVAYGNKFLLPGRDDLALVDPSYKQVWIYRFPRLTMSDQKILAASPTVLSNGNILCWQVNNVLACLNPEGRLAWQTEIRGALLGPPTAGSDGIAYLTIDGKLQAIDSEGVVVKSTSFIGTNLPPAVDEKGNLIIALSKGGICSVKPVR